MLTAWIPSLNAALIVVLMQYVALRQRVSEYGKNALDKYPVLKKIRDGTCYLFLFIKARLESKKIEPLATNWVLLSSHCHTKEMFGLQYNQYVEYEYTELYPSQTQSVTECARVYRLYIHRATSRLYSNYFMRECVLMMKIQNRHLVRVFKRELPNGLELEPEELFRPSRVKFISIELVFPDKEKSYVIDLDKSMYLVHNEILSYGFLSRYLDHHYGTGLMDDNYLLNIMDNNMSTAQLKRSDHIFLDHSSYKIVRLEK
jgi:hypothetical protein